MFLSYALSNNEALHCVLSGLPVVLHRSHPKSRRVNVPCYYVIKQGNQISGRHWSPENLRVCFDAAESHLRLADEDRRVTLLAVLFLRVTLFTSSLPSPLLNIILSFLSSPSPPQPSATISVSTTWRSLQQLLAL